jgi:hypothetical protein
MKHLIGSLPLIVLAANCPAQTSQSKLPGRYQSFLFILNHKSETMTVNVGAGLYDLIEGGESPASVTLSAFGYKVLRKAR